MLRLRMITAISFYSSWCLHSADSDNTVCFCFTYITGEFCFTVQINWPTRCNSFTSLLLLDVLFRSTCFGRLRAHHQELTTALTASGFTLERGGSSVVSRGLATLLPSRSKVKPEAVNSVVSSWRWAWRRPKHVERHKTSNNKLVKLSHLVR